MRFGIVHLIEDEVAKAIDDRFAVIHLVGLDIVWVCPDDEIGPKVDRDHTPDCQVFGL